METMFSPLSTGIPALDKVLQNIMPGDNIVWQVDSVDEYTPFVRPFAEHAVSKGKKLIYFRFSPHEELLTADSGAEIHTIDPQAGFETAASGIYRIISESGNGAYFVFDCLSDFVDIWFSDLMLSNLFMIVCPFVYDLDSVAYFAVLRNRHSLHVTASIRDTTQIILDVYHHKDNLYVHPKKVRQRHSPTMYMPHIWDDDCFKPVTNSATVSEVVSEIMGSGLDSTSRVVDIWDRIFMQAVEAHDTVERGEKLNREIDDFFLRLMKMIFSQDETILKLAARYLDLSDIISIRKRMVGTGLIGGKSVGMITSRAILNKTDIRWKNILEIHDSFFIGSDVFYTYIVRNGLWRVRQKQRNKKTFLDGIDEARQRMLTGDFPEFIENQFVEMLDYFGQSPIIVRSSSLLEDNFGNAFSGKYDSVFCVNQGTRTERLKAFLSAVRTVYASTMNREALIYRQRRGLLDSDEQMALLVQRVSGAVYGTQFFPHMAGVGFSFNPFAWSEKIKPEAGMLRLVCGLGTRAVDRHDDDYTRVVSLNEPELRPEGNFDKVKEYAQRRVDVLDLHENTFTSRRFEELVTTEENFPMEIVASIDTAANQTSPEGKDNRVFPWVLTFERLLTKTPFVDDMRDLLASLQSAYNYPVDIEFTTNFLPNGDYRINIVQCRPFQTSGNGMVNELPDNVDDISQQDIILDSHGAIIGPSMASHIDRIVYIVPALYGELPERERHAVARLIGRVTHHKRDGEKTIMLMGPGRWGSAMPSLGIPVKFAEINTVSVLCELVEMNENLIPDVSLGTHFFNDIVEFRMLYCAFFPDVKGNYINRQYLENSPNRLDTLFPGQEHLKEVVRVIDTADMEDGRKLYMSANTVRQRAVCYWG
ncbi:PEP/pyruvate-binding domain-containing protein, partial [Candidatus Latescibacterota bacterium]